MDNERAKISNLTRIHSKAPIDVAMLLNYDNKNLTIVSHAFGFPQFPRIFLKQLISWSPLESIFPPDRSNNRHLISGLGWI